MIKINYLSRIHDDCKHKGNNLYHFKYNKTCLLKRYLETKLSLQFHYLNKQKYLTTYLKYLFNIYWTICLWINSGEYKHIPRINTKVIGHIIFLNIKHKNLILWHGRFSENNKNFDFNNFNLLREALNKQ